MTRIYGILLMFLILIVEDGFEPHDNHVLTFFSQMLCITHTIITHL
jgi:hypothetical protein